MKKPHVENVKNSDYQKFASAFQKRVEDRLKLMTKSEMVKPSKISKKT